MATLIKTSTGQILGGREFWSLENGFEVIASDRNGSCTLFVSSKKNGKNIELVSKYLEAKKLPHQLTSTIDSYALVVSSERKQEALMLIESWVW